MKDPLASPKLRLSVAQEDIGHIKNTIVEFINSKPYAQAVDTDPDGIHQTHKLKLIKPIPERLGHQCVRVAEDLRSALDQTGYAMAVAGGVAAPRFAYFPIANNEANFQNILKGNCKDLPSDIKALFASYKAYKGSDNVLYALNVLCNTGKHRLIRPAVSMASTHQIDRIQGSGELSFPKAMWEPETNDIVLFKTGPSSKIGSAQGKITFFVAFGEVDVIGGLGVEPVLETMAARVETILSETEVKAREIELIP